MMELISYLFDLFLHLDDHLSVILQTYGTWTYLILTTVIFLETGVVITPFLPGDSLLFAAGAFAGTGDLHVGLLFGLLFAAAVAGDTVNYWIGNKIGPRVFEMDIRFLKKEYLDRTHEFYVRHGGKTIFLARFVPILRTFAPFVAGVGSMPYSRFLAYNIFGGFVWTASFIFAGYFFGNLPVVQENFSWIIVAIILISVAPMGVEFVLHRLRKRRQPDVVGTG